MKDITFLIQGSLKEDTYKFYCQFYPDIKKIFSTWKNNTFSNKWRGEYSLHSDDDLIIENEMPNRIGCWERRMELDLISTLSGLEKTKTKYMLKLRGDEWYQNLKSVVELCRDNDEKIFMTSSFIKKWDIWPFRINNHLMAGTTDNFKIMYESSMVNMVTRKELFENCWPLPYQSILALSYIKRKNIECIDLIKYFQELFEIVPLDPLKFYKINSDDGNQTWYSNFKEKFKNIKDIF